MWNGMEISNIYPKILKSELFIGAACTVYKAIKTYVVVHTVVQLTNRLRHEWNGICDMIFARFDAWVVYQKS